MMSNHLTHKQHRIIGMIKWLKDKLIILKLFLNFFTGLDPAKVKLDKYFVKNLYLLNFWFQPATHSKSWVKGIQVNKRWCILRTKHFDKRGISWRVAIIGRHNVLCKWRSRSTILQWRSHKWVIVVAVFIHLSFLIIHKSQNVHDVRISSVFVIWPMQFSTTKNHWVFRARVVVSWITDFHLSSIRRTT